MQISHNFLSTNWRRLLIVAGLLFALSLILVSSVRAENGTTTGGGRLVTFYDRGQEKVILTHAGSVRDALKDAAISVAPEDIVEPGRDSELVATDYVVNIYRARPMIVVDGPVRQKIMTAAQTARDITKAAGVELHDEDRTVLAASNNIAADGASVTLTIDRATPLTLKLYGTVMATYSQATTVGEMLDQKGVKLAASDTVSPGRNTPLTAGMTVEIWRDGVQTATVEEPIDFSVRTVFDADRPVGYHAVQTPGVKGKKNVVYEITASSGKEIGRKAIQGVTVEEAKEQVEIVGTKPGPKSLTKAKGAQQYTDSKGVTHRETYYDLPMNVVMGACGGGTYTIRVDGAKVDKDGYILVAANLGNYPRCSVVETSMGPGKVYDTGGFAAAHPHGFDLATDWTNNDGR
jgi:uncharacterized protein YabE (DUF348 family)